MDFKLSVFVLSLLMPGCAYRKPIESYLPAKDDSRYKMCLKASKHPLYNIVPRHREQIRSCDFFHWATWAFAGNDDNGIFGELSSKPYSTNIFSKTFLHSISPLLSRGGLLF